MRESLRLLLDGLIDYAGLFPPASLSMDAAARNYSSYLTSDDRFALGRFIVPAARLEELTPHLTSGQRWRLSVLAGGASDASLMASFNRAQAQRAAIDSVEVKAASEAEVSAAAEAYPDLIRYCEIAPERIDLLPAIVASGGRAKLRTGGVTADAFPSHDSIAAFIEACHSEGASFKATAGLHHPVRCDRPLTYEPDAPVGTMHGFVNLFLAATFIRNGMRAIDAARLLLDGDPKAFRFEDERVVWREYTVTSEQIAECRANFAASFGSCSFEEPVADLRELGWW